MQKQTCLRYPTNFLNLEYFFLVLFLFCERVFTVASNLFCISASFGAPSIQVVSCSISPCNAFFGKWHSIAEDTKYGTLAHGPQKLCALFTRIAIRIRHYLGVLSRSSCLLRNCIVVSGLRSVGWIWIDRHNLGGTNLGINSTFWLTCALAFHTPMKRILQSLKGFTDRMLCVLPLMEAASVDGDQSLTQFYFFYCRIIHAFAFACT